MSLKEDIIKIVRNLSDEQQKRLLCWLKTLQKEKIKLPTGKLGMKKPFQREDLYHDVFSHRL